MGNPTFANVITPQEMTLGLSHLLVAPEGTAWTPAKVDVDAPPAGFIHLGAVEDGSPSFSVNKELYSVPAGIPAATAYQAVVGVAGQIGMTLHTFDPYAAYLTLGGFKPYLMPKTASAGYTSALATTGHSRTLVHINTPGNFAVNDLIVTDTSAALNTSRNYAWVTQVNSVTGAGSLTLQGTGLPFTPSSSAMPCVAVAYSRLALGTSIIPSFRLLAVADFIDGGQIVHDIQRAQPAGEFTQAIRNGQHIMSAVAFNCLGYQISTPHSSSGQVVIGELLCWMPSTTQ